MKGETSKQLTTDVLQWSKFLFSAGATVKEIRESFIKNYNKKKDPDWYEKLHHKKWIETFDLLVKNNFIK